MTTAERRLMDIRADVATRLQVALHAVRWSQRSLAAFLGWDDRTVRRWLAGAQEPPGGVVEWLETLARAHEANPPPGRAR